MRSQNEVFRCFVIYLTERNLRALFAVGRIYRLSAIGWVHRWLIFWSIKSLFLLEPGERTELYSVKSERKQSHFSLFGLGNMLYVASLARPSQHLARIGPLDPGTAETWLNLLQVWIRVDSALGNIFKSLIKEWKGERKKVRDYLAHYLQNSRESRHQPWLVLSARLKPK